MMAVRITCIIVGAGILFGAIAAWKFWGIGDVGAGLLGLFGIGIIYEAIPDDIKPGF